MYYTARSQIHNVNIIGEANCDIQSVYSYIIVGWKVVLQEHAGGEQKLKR